ncbi:methylamine utilization protein [Leptospira mayottensis]|uniref:Blue (type 1) copper domain-containing protein n=2 Tax=Leptospira mayottensis TaxID=1137606 RepID=A0AA87MQ78_9LEPT|nr:methylamine utilization protein [Leptospira mayottensis]AXR59358.1 methylamine utilization protein [Leptospira mayottensis]AXR62231.1 methylamine utilization protein [Leptospira mayottensis]AXR63140.1 methylamine utilization protein [Leptospira mayottensis]AXR66915.1 methylamine utilization protein [Leptospira mayottensis]AZQ01331.1 methylamine utilization protein [Leptospira mayottensis 200901116]
MLVRFTAVFIFLVFCGGSLAAAEHEVGQKNKGFTVESLKIKVGDVVSFPNYDTFYHNVYSLSPTKIFDLGSYSQGKTQKVKFEKPGKITVQCAIHPEMKMTIDVQ